jgi:hypothetical protein
VRRFALLASLFCATASPAVALAGYVAHPTITEGLAKEWATSYMHKNDAHWRYRTSGGIDCRRGRLNRYSWACRVHYREGGFCASGRVNVIYEYKTDGKAGHSEQYNGRPC